MRSREEEEEYVIANEDRRRTTVHGGFDCDEMAYEKQLSRIGEKRTESVLLLGRAGLDRAMLLVFPWEFLFTPSIYLKTPLIF